MKQQKVSSLGKLLLLLTTTAAATGVFLGLPMKKASAASQNERMMPGPMVNQQATRITVIQPRFVSPTAMTLLKIADQALSDNALAERISRDPDGVAKQYHLSNAELLVLRHMNRAQFATARADAAQVVSSRMSYAGSMRMPPGATDIRQITERMVVGRAILAAAGRSYLDAANAHACCPWSKAIELGLSGDPASYNSAFTGSGGASLPE
jgi:hypothetical protein